MTIYKPYGNAAYKYGNTSRLYGDGSATDDAVHWAIEVDWFNTGSYDGSSEAAYAIGLETTAGRKQFLEVGDNRTFTGYKFPDVGTCRVTLDNSTRRFDPYYASGDLYGNILPGRFIRVRVTYHGVTYNVFHGNIAKITPYDTGEKNTVVLDCEDGKRWFINGDYNSNGITTNQFQITQALAVANNVASSRLGVMAVPPERVGTESPYFWTYGTVSGMAAVEDIIRIKADQYWFGEDGKFYAKNDYGPQQMPIEANDITEANTLKQIAIPVPWEEVINVVTKHYYPRTAITGFMMWEGLEKPLIAPGGSYTFFPTATYNNEVVPSLIGSATIAITANTLADGTGTNLLLFGGVISGADATSCILTVTNYEAVSGYVTAVNLTGTIYYAERATTTTEDAASIAIYGRHRLVVSNEMNHDGVYNYVGTNYAISTIEVQIQSRPDIQFDYRLMHRADVTIDRYNISAETRQIGYKAIKWLDNSGQNVLTTLRLEPVR